MTTRDYLRVKNVTKRFGRFTALEDVSFSAGRGEFLSVLGPSGCGKTTILRVIAGLETQTGGQVFITDREVSDLPVSKRHVGIVFQSYALFPNLSARENVAYGLTSNMKDNRARNQKVDELLQLVGLKGYGSKYPAQLSGGQQQRVALARAMALSPNLLLLDEPLSALDAQVRIHLRSEIRQLQQRLGVTTIMVTHDQEEALTMADRILVMNEGRLVQIGTPHEIYDRPATPFVASFIGSMNFLSGASRLGDGVFRKGVMELRVDDGRNLSQADTVTMAIRPEDVQLLADAVPGPNTVPGRVCDLEFRGSSYRARLSLPENGAKTPEVEADVSSEVFRRLSLEQGANVRVHFPADRIRVYADNPAAQA